MQKGDFVLIDYTGRVASTNEIFDTTVGPEAKVKLNYHSVLVIIGANMVIKGLEHQIETMKVGEERQLNIEAKDAFGPRNPAFSKVIPLKNFTENKINPVPGEHVVIDFKSARIVSVTSGRVKVDFNHPLAGKEVRYWVKLVKVLDTAEDKVNSIADYLGIRGKFTITDSKLKKGRLLIQTESVQAAGEVGKKDERVEKFKDMVREWVSEVKDVELEYKEK